MDENLITRINEEEFDKLTFESGTPVMVMFGADRCHVCKELLPTVEEIASDYAVKMKVYWVDVDAFKGLFQRLRLRGIPQLLIFNGGEVQEHLGGLHSKEEIVEAIERVIA
ncbi:MAG: thioredoxin family protein [Firmicutes bacterium]|nr:thioredoxin family protein [Bacillota bacterium]